MGTRLAIGKIMHRLGCGLTVAAFGSMGYYSRAEELVPEQASKAASLFVIFALTGILALWLGRRLSIVPAEAVKDDGDEGRILYLRSFQDDLEPSVWGLIRSITRTLPLGRGFQTKEERLAAMMNRIGRLIALGRPGEKHPPPGASRRYLRTQEWTDQIEAEFPAADLIVFRVGANSQGFWSEVAMATRKANPERLLYWFPDASTDSYETFRCKSDGYLPRRLPQSTRGVYFLYFDGSWEPRLITSLAWWSGWWLLYPLISVNEFSALARLKPLFEQNGLPDPAQAFIGTELLTTIGGIAIGYLSHMAISPY